MADITDGQLTSIRAQCLRAASDAMSVDSTRMYPVNEILLVADKYFEWVMEEVSDDP